MKQDEDISLIICQFIYNNWIVNDKSQRSFAISHDIEESTVRKIKNVALGTSKIEYNMSLKTLGKICKARNKTLKEFFNEINI